MINQARAQAKNRLADLIKKVLADGQIDASEKTELQGIYKQAVLTVSDVKEVLAQYLQGLEKEVRADGVITDEERQRCRAVVEQLKIPVGLLTPEFRQIIG